MNTWQESWSLFFNLPEAAPQWIVAVFALIASFVFVVVPSAAFISYCQRKLGADFQARVGPNRAGPFGLLQPIADFLKLVQKESAGRQRWQEGFWYAVLTMALYSTVAVMPLGSTILLVDTDMSAFLPFWSVLVLALGMVLLGLDQGEVNGWLGGIRIAAQSLAGAFPALVSLLCAGLYHGSFKWSAIAENQGAHPFSWTALSNPFQLCAFFVFLLSGMVMLSVAPFDSGLSKTDIKGGVASSLSGRRLGAFKFGQFYGFFLWSIISVVLFCGGWNIPDFISERLRETQNWRLMQLCEISTLFFKVFSLMMAIGWVTRVNPRIRADQATDLTWKVLGPLALAVLMGSALLVGGKAFL